MARVSVIVSVRDATREGLRRVRSSVNSLNRGILQTLSATFSDGIGQSLALGFQKAMSNPFVAAAVVALVAVLTTQLGAALGGALVLAFGAAFIGLGIMAVKNSKRVKDAFSRELKGLKKEFADAAKPLIPVLESAAKRMGRLGRAFSPMFARAMKDAAPHLENFLNKLEVGLGKTAKIGFKPMMDAFNDLLDAIDWVGFFENLGKSFRNLGKAVSENRMAVGGLFDAILGLIPKAINLLAWFVRAWGYIEEPVSAIWELFKQSLTPAFAAFGTVIKMIADIFVAISPVIRTFTEVLKIAQDVLSGLARDLGSVFSPMWHGFLDGLHDGWELLADDLVPIFKDFYTILGDTVRRVIDVFLPGLDDMQIKGKNAGQTIKEWIIDKLAALGDWLSEHRDDIRSWMQTASDKVVEFAGWIKNTAIPALVEFGKWIWEKRWVLALLMTGIGLIITAIHWAGVLWGWVKRAWEIFLEVSGINTVLRAIRLGKELWGWVSRNWRAALKFTGLGSIESAIRIVKRLWDWVDRNWFRSVTLSVSIPGYSTLKSAWNMITSAFAHGGVASGLSKAATGGLRSGLTLVGEAGPELVRLPSGSSVKSNPDTRRMFRQAGQQGGAAMLMLKSSGRRVDDMLIEILREAIHQRGGDPVTVLGG